MASVNIANALVAMCLALCGAALGEDANSRACVLAKPCICTGTKVNCRNRQLRSIPAGIPLGTSSLDLSSNELSTLDMAKLSRLTNLQELLLHENQLREIPPWQALPSSLIRLSLHHNKITSISSQNVTKRMSLRYLFLNSNRISTIGQNAFANLTSVQSMKLSRNRLTSIPVAALSQLTSLKKLDLTKNLIKAINFPLKSLNSLGVLKLSKNKISFISRSCFWQMTYLRELYLDNNNLTSVSTSWFFGLSSLQKLYLNNNRIRGIDKSQGAGFDWRAVLLLGELNLAKNELSHIDETTFAHLSNLRRLDLGSNHIYHIAEGAFSDLNSLQVLDLSNNALSSTLEGMNGVFSGLQKLIMLRLDGNRITWIAANAFTGLTAVKSLNLSANIITSIEENSFLEMRNLNYLYLNTTQLLCNCKLSWLPVWLVSKGFKPYVHALCLHPKPLERKSIFNLTFPEFVCGESDSKPEIIKHPQGHKVVQGQNVTLQCMVTQKNHTIRVNWTKNNKPLTGAYIITHAQSKDGDMATYTSELRLVSVTDKDDGYYQCVASNQFAPVQSKMAHITVLVFPKLIEKPTNVSVAAGKTFKLRCRAAGHPDPVLSWQKDGGSSFPAANDRRMDFETESKVYTIKNAQPVDTGKYTCSATNDAGSVNATAFVTVLETPHFVRRMRSEVTVPVGGSVVLECFAGGAPQPYIAWFKGTARVRSDSHVVFAESGQMLVIAEADEDDGGSYTCEATNSQGTVSHGVELIIETEKCTSVTATEKFNKSKYVKYDKKTFLGIIVVVVVSCIVVTSMVWLFIQYNTLSCGKKKSGKRRSQYAAAPFGADCSEESKAYQHEDISYIPLKISSSGSTQTSRESPRSTATFLTSSESAQGPCIVANLASSSENASGTEEKSSTVDNVSSENSLKGSHSSLTSSCPSDACPSYQQVVTSAQIHVSDSDSEKHRSGSPADGSRNNSRSTDPGGGEHKLDISDSSHCCKETSSPQRPLIAQDNSDSSPRDALSTDVCVTVYPLTNSDTSCVTDGVDSSVVET